MIVCVTDRVLPYRREHTLVCTRFRSECKCHGGTGRAKEEGRRPDRPPHGIRSGPCALRRGALPSQAHARPTYDRTSDRGNCPAAPRCFTVRSASTSLGLCSRWNIPYRIAHVRNELLLLCLARARECVVSSCFPGPEVDDGSQLTASSPAWAARDDHCAISGKARVVACGMD
jgi:hypothetical protein